MENWDNQASRLGPLFCNMVLASHPEGSDCRDGVPSSSPSGKQNPSGVLQLWVWMPSPQAAGGCGGSGFGEGRRSLKEFMVLTPVRLFLCTRDGKVGQASAQLPVLTLGNGDFHE